MSSSAAAPDLDEVLALARAQFEAHGGLPQLTDPEFLRRRWSDVAFGLRDAGGALVSAAVVRSGSSVGSGSTVFWLTGAPPGEAAGHVLDLALTGVGAAEVTVECESVVPAVDEMLASRGLRQVFAEDVLTADLTAEVPEPRWPDGTVLLEWDDDSARRFFAVYDASFRERPGFPGWSAEEWIEGMADDDARPSASLLACVPGIGDAGFVTAAAGWIDQVGVVPPARGRGLAGALVSESLRRLRAGGDRTAWLTVNVDNDARRVWERIGFTGRGRRGRYRF